MVVLSVVFVVSLMLVSAVPFAVASSFFYRTYGGTGKAYCVVQTRDGGYVLAGITEFYGDGDRDFRLVKTDPDGNMEWNKTYGGPKDDFAHSVVQTSDGGYAIEGYTNSFGAGSYNFWLVKTDSSGNMEWNQTYEGPSNDRAYAMVQTSDGGYAIVGTGNTIFIKTDPDGNIEWNKTYKELGYCDPTAVAQTSDDGYAIVGTGNTRFIKTDSHGNMEWNKTYEELGGAVPTSVVQTSDGGYAMAGYKGYTNCWLVKMDSAGNMAWNKTYTFSSVGDSCSSMIQTKDGGYLLAGEKGFTTMLLIKTDSLGNMEWNQTHGYGDANSVIETSDGGYAMAGYTLALAESPTFCLVKTDEAGIIPEFPSWTPLLLALTVLAFVAAVYRKGISSRNIPE